MRVHFKVSNTSRNQEMSRLTPAELNRYLPCFYDLPIKDVSRMLKCSYYTILKHCDQRPWPHALLKKKQLNFSWIDVQWRRDLVRARRDTPSHILEFLAKADNRGWMLRRLYDDTYSGLFDGLYEVIDGMDG
jgi:hypothetical protein